MEQELEIKNMAMDIVRSGQSKAVVISLGAAGILMVSQEGHEHIQPPTVPIVSKVGAPRTAP